MPEPSSSTEMRRRARRLRCPCCGMGAPYDGMFQMRERCEVCNFKFEREAGYFLGSIYVNYGITAGVGLGWTFGWMVSGEERWWITMLPAAIFAVLFPLWFTRYARLLWIAFDLRWDPPTEADFRS